MKRAFRLVTVFLAALFLFSACTGPDEALFSGSSTWGSATWDSARWE